MQQAWAVLFRLPRAPAQTARARRPSRGGGTWVWWWRRGGMLSGPARRTVQPLHTSRRLWAAPGTPRGKQKLLRGKGFLRVGRAGIEPATERFSVAKTHITDPA